ncbi:BRISC and BRCA1-A complex member 2-like [Uloborus diversus]|uniref:BRISC and BRCA1-A complex member 2-like n=1 Tax=Uloborus diversus TaxID=327109 RepID=UPI0024090CEE|nr:BRISC and BRCA1-A complex member 2-like [Uloborus diversus]
MSVSCFAPHVQVQLEEIIKRGKIGICPGSIKILNPLPSCPAWVKNALYDRFKLVIPYGGHCVDWFIIFQASFPDNPPDFVFMEPFDLNLEDVPSLMNWDIKKRDSLLIVLKELLQQYQKQQAARLEKYSRVQFEYSTLIQQTDVKEEDIEVSIGEDKEGPINFLIRLGVIFSGLPYIFKSESGEDTALLLVTFNDPEGTKITPKLCLPPKIEHALGSPISWRIPAFSSDGCLMDYVPFVQESLKKRVDMVVYSYDKRKEYLSAFLNNFEGCYIEYDRDLALKASFLLEQNDFYFIFQIDLPQNFPMNKPSFTFRSVYHSSFEKPISTTVINYPYSQAWSSEVMLEKAVEFIQDYAMIFQRNSVQNGLSP